MDKSGVRRCKEVLMFMSIYDTSNLVRVNMDSTQIWPNKKHLSFHDKSQQVKTDGHDLIFRVRKIP